MKACKHNWVSEGGRSCPKNGGDMYIGKKVVMGETVSIYCNQPVYHCSFCGEYDYGEPGGPAHTECKKVQ